MTDKQAMVGAVLVLATMCTAEAPAFIQLPLIALIFTWLAYVKWST